MAASDFLRRRVAEDEKKNGKKQGTTASTFLQDLAKGSKETALDSFGAKMGSWKSSYEATKRTTTPTKERAGNTPAPTLLLPGIGGMTANPLGKNTLPTIKPTTGDTTRSRKTTPAPVSSLALPSIGGVTANPVGRSSATTMSQLKRKVAERPTEKSTVDINLDKKLNHAIVNRGTVNPMVGRYEEKTDVRSNATDRKTMLYQTNDKLLTPQEVIEKYQYVVNDPNMDKETRHKAAKKGLTATGKLRDKNLLSSAMGDEESKELIRQVTELQGDLTYMTKDYARGSGFADAFGLNLLGKKLTENAVDKSGDESLRKAVEKRYTLGQRTVEENPLSVTGGRFVGEGLKFMSFSPWIEATAAKALGATSLTGGKAFLAQIAGQQAADTLLTTPFVIAEGVEQKKSRTEIAKDVAKQQGMDLAFNVGFGALEVGGKTLKNVIANKKEEGKFVKNIIEGQNAVTPDELMQAARKNKFSSVEPAVTDSGEILERRTGMKPIDVPESSLDIKNPLMDEQNNVKKVMDKNGNVSEIVRYEPSTEELPRIQSEYKNAVDEKIVSFIKELNGQPTANWKKLQLKPVSEKMAADVSELMGYDVRGYSNVLDASAIKHIENRHGTVGKADQLMADVDDIARMQYVLDNYDSVRKEPTFSYHYKNADGTAGQQIRFEKRINGTYYVVGAVPNNKKRTISIVTAFKSKKIEVPLVPDANSPRLYVRNEPEITSNFNISDGFRKINGFVEETAEKSAKTTDIQTPSDIVKNGKDTKGLITAKELPGELLEEYNKLNDADYIENQLREVAAKTGNNDEVVSKTLADMNKRRNDLESMLGIRTGKVKDMERKLKNELNAELKNLFYLSGKEATDETKKLVGMAIDEGMNGRITQETRDMIFDALFNQGTITNKETVDQALKAQLRQLKLQISPIDAANIPDFKAWSKGTMGKLGGVRIKEGGGNVDRIYLELSDLYPHIFPDNISNPGEQLQRIGEVAASLAYKKTPLSETMGGAEKEGLRREFDEILDKIYDVSSRVSQYKGERVKTQRRLLMRQGLLENMTTDEVHTLFNKRYEINKELERVRKWSQLNKSEELMVKQLLDGRITFDDIGMLPIDNLTDRMRKMTAVYRLEKDLRIINDSITGYQRRNKKEIADQVAEMVGELTMRDKGKEGWKDMPVALMARETQERILDKVTPNKETAEAIKRGIFDKLHENERDRINFVREMKDRMEKTNIKTTPNITLRFPQGTKEYPEGTFKLSESGIVQWLGEKRYQLKQLEAMKKEPSPYEMNQIRQLHTEITAAEMAVSKEQLAKIDKAIVEMTGIYKEIYQNINGVLIRNGYEPVGYIEGYFPHMNFDEPDSLFDMMGSKLGFDFSSKELPMDIAGRTETFKPGKKFAGNLLKREGMQTDYDALRAFDLYIDNVSDVIHHTDDIQRLRAFENNLRYNLSDEGIKAKVDAVKNDPNLEEIDKASRIEEIYSNVKNHTLQGYVNNLRIYTDGVAGKKHPLDRPLETSVFGRKVYKAVTEIENRVAGNMVAGNIGSAMTNVIPITQGMSGMGVKSNLRGLKEAMEYMGKGEVDALTKKSAFLSTRQPADLLYQTGLRKLSNKVALPMELADRFSTQAVWRSKYYDNMAKGMGKEEAIRNADRFARGLFAGRSKGAMPTMFSSKALKPLTMFQLEVNNQISYLLKDLPKEAQGNAAKMVKTYSGILLSAYIYNDVYEKLTGRRSALDPLGTAREAVGNFTGTTLRNTVDIGKDMAQGKGLQLTQEQTKQKPGKALTALGEDIGGNVPFVGGILFDGGRIPLTSAIPQIGSVTGAIGDAASGDGTWQKAGDVAKKELSKPFYYVGMPFGGGQLRKTVQGLETMNRGGSYSVTNKGEQLQFSVDKGDPLKWAQAAMFGKWALPEGQAYLKGTKALGEEQTSTHGKLVANGISGTNAYETLTKISEPEKIVEKRTVLRQAVLNDGDRAIIYYDMLASEKERSTMDMLRKLGEKDETIYRCLDQLTEVDASNKKRNIILNTRMSNDAKKYLYRESVGKDDDETIYTFSQAGMDMNDFIKVKNYFYVTNNRSLPSKEKRQMFVNWLLQNGYNEEQRWAVYERFRIAKKYRE